MDREEATPVMEELKRVLKDKVGEDQIMRELEKYIDTYKLTLDQAKRGIIRKYGDPETDFVSAASVRKKIGELTGSEQSVDVLAKVVFVERRTVNARGRSKEIISGILGDETATASFTVWDGDPGLEKGQVYDFRNVYTKKWNDKVQVNAGSRASISKSGAKLDLPERDISFAPPSEVKIGEIREGMGGVTTTGRVLTVEAKTVTARGEQKTVYSGLMADDTGKIQFSAWRDFGLREGETIRAENAYVRGWKGIPQLNMGDRCAVSVVDDTFDDAEIGKTSPKTVAEILKAGGGLDITVSGTAVDLRAGSGLIRRCPQCNRSVLGTECAAHGAVSPVPDLRMKLVVDDGTGAISAIVNRDLTEKLSGVTLEEAVDLSKAFGPEVVAKRMAERVLIRRVTIRGNVMSDDYGPMMIVREASMDAVDTAAEAERLLAEVEAAL